MNPYFKNASRFVEATLSIFSQSFDKKIKFFPGKMTKPVE